MNKKEILFLTWLLFIVIIQISCSKKEDVVVPTSPTASFSVSIGSSGSITINNTSTGGNESYSWDFGDGIGKSTDKNPTYSYTYNGQYSITLTVTNSVGTAKTSQVVNITKGKDAIVKANFNIGDDSDMGFFENSSTGADTYLWDFGDGTTSTEKSPSMHRYKYNDLYSVKLTATHKASGKVDSVRKNMTIRKGGTFSRLFESNNNSTVFIASNIIGLGYGYTYAIDATNGKIKWRAFTESTESCPTFVDKQSLIILNDNKIRNVDMSNGNLMWTYAASYISNVTPYINNPSPPYSKEIYSRHWSYDKQYIVLYYDFNSVSFGGSINPAYSLDKSSPTGLDGKVYFADEAAKLYCYNGINKVWEASVGTAGAYEGNTGPLAANGKIYVGGTGNFYAFDAKTGTKIWSQKLYGTSYSSPTFANDKVYFCSLDNILYALDANNGNIIWQKQISTIKNTFGSDVLVSSPFVSDGVVYIGNSDKKMYAFDAENGTKIWDFPTSAAIYSSPVVAEGVVYITNKDAMLYAIDAKTAAKKWELSLGKNMTVEVSPSVLTSTGGIFHSSVNGLRQ